ncbi:hypothetical protein DL93DRAFT_2173163 [Clavulina sp. PMI_390]|nr:hypothetical protein DL93DRAFT_2173163 [Clavulina sp. PMI_390]
MSFTKAFPLEIQGEILSYLPVSDLKNCALAARSWSIEASRLLWNSIKLDVTILGPVDLGIAGEKLSRFMNTLVLNVECARYIHRLTMNMDARFHRRIDLDNLGDSSSFLDISWEVIHEAFSHLNRLQYLELQGRLLSPQFVRYLYETLSTAPIRAIYTIAPIETLDRCCSIWASSITDLLIADLPMGKCPELPCLPHLRFLASDNIELDNEEVMLQTFVGSLECPTLEHIHFVLQVEDWFMHLNMADYVTFALETRPPSTSNQALPALKSMRFELYNTDLDTTPSQPLRSDEQTSSNLKTEAGLRLSNWLWKGNHPPSLQNFQLYSLGAAGDTPSTYRIVNLSAIRPFPVSGDPNVWEITDSMEDVTLEPGTYVFASGLVHPLVRTANRATLPVISDPDGVIRCI